MAGEINQAMMKSTMAIIQNSDQRRQTMFQAVQTWAHYHEVYIAGLLLLYIAGLLNLG